MEIKKNKVSGLYETPIRFMSNQPDKENAIAYCNYNKHKGYLSTKMVKEHECLKKQCPFLIRYHHPYWVEKVSAKVYKKLQNGDIDYFIAGTEVYDNSEIDQHKIRQIMCLYELSDTNQFIFRKDEDMVTFGENLNTWKVARKIDTKSLGSRSGLGEDRIKKLLEDKVVPNQSDIEKIARVFQVSAATFCKGVTIPKIEKNVNSEGNNENSEYSKVIDFYYSGNVAFKKGVASRFADWLLSKTTKPAIYIDDMCGLSRSTFSSYKRKKEPMSKAAIEKIGKAFNDAGILALDEYYNKLQSLCNKWIPNGNLCLLREYYKISSTTFAKVLNCFDSTVRGMFTFKNSIKEDYAKILSDLIGVDLNVFTTVNLTNANLPSKKVMEAKIAALTSDSNSSPVPTKEEKPGVKPIAKQPEPEPEPEPVPAPMPAITISQPENNNVDKLQKMYNRLSQAHKQEIDTLIEKYFWEDL